MTTVADSQLGETEDDEVGARAVPVDEEKSEVDTVAD